MLVGEFQRSGLPASKFAQLAGVRYHTFWNWLREHGLTVAEMVRTTLEKQPENATLWSTRSMAGKLGLSQQGADVPLFPTQPLITQDLRWNRTSKFYSPPYVTPLLIINETCLTGHEPPNVFPPSRGTIDPVGTILS